jgi:hypothetical protein
MGIDNIKLLLVLLLVYSIIMFDTDAVPNKMISVNDTATTYTPMMKGNYKEWQLAKMCDNGNDQIVWIKINIK